jgi:hypothetical protein
VPVPCFMLFLCFRKVTQEIFSELDKTKAVVPNYLTWRRSPKESRRRTRGQPHMLVARARPRPRHQGVWPPGPPPDIALPPIYSPWRENPRSPNSFSENILWATVVIDARLGGPEALPGTLPERGITTGGLLHHHACLRSDVWVVYLGLRVHSSS